MLAGRVCDDEDRPVAGATVELAPTERTLVTDDDGGFAFDAVPPGRYALVAHKDDHYAGPAMVYLDEAGSPPVVLRMQRGVTLVVHVTGDGTPLADARVMLRPSLGDANLQRSTLYASTNADGVVTIRGLAPPHASAWVVAPDRAPKRLMISTGVDPGGIVEAFVRLERGALIEGRVLGPRKRPVPDARVELWSDNGTGYRADTDERGAWSLRARAGSYHLLAASRDYWLGHESTLVCDGTTPMRDVVLKLGYRSLAAAVAALLPERIRSSIRNPPIGRIAGVVREETGVPVGGALVHALGKTNEGQDWHRTLTDARGYFVFDETPLGEYSIGAAWPHAPPHRDPPEVRARTGDMHVDLVLPTYGTVTARVLLDDTPMPHVGVVIDELASHGGGTPRGHITRDGRFTIEHVPPGTWQLAVWAPGARIKKCTGLVVAGGATLDLGDLAMERGQRVTGHVRDRDGTPVSGASVAILDISSRSGGESSSRLAQCFRGTYRATTDDDGAFAFDGVDRDSGLSIPTGRPAVVQAWHPRAGVSLLAQLPPDDPTTVDLVLHGAGAIDGVIEGYRPGHSLAFARRPDEPERERFAGVDNEGRFRFDDVPAGDYTITVDDNSTSATVTVTPGETVTARLVLTSSIVELRVRVHGAKADQRLVIEREDTPPAKQPWRMINRSMRMNEIFVQSEYLEPGKYLASLDRKTWLPITVAAEPPRQEIEVQVSDGRLLRVARPARRR